MGAPDVLARLAAAGIKVKPLPDGRVWAEPAVLLTDDLRDLVRQHRAELLAVLAAEARRQKVLDMLDANRTARYAVTADAETDPEAVIVALAIRGRATCEIRIPRDKYDGTLLLDLIERHGGTV